MNKIGRKNTVLLSLVVTIVSLLLPIFGETFTIMLISFSLLGIGNALIKDIAKIHWFQVIGGNNLAQL